MASSARSGKQPLLHDLPAEVLGRVVEWLQHLRVVDGDTRFGSDKLIKYDAPGADLPALALGDYFASASHAANLPRDLEALKRTSRTVRSKLRECRPVIAVYTGSVAEALAEELYGTWRAGCLRLASRTDDGAPVAVGGDLRYLTPLSSLHTLDLSGADLLSDSNGGELNDQGSRMRMASIRLPQLRRLSLRDARFHLEQLVSARLPRLDSLVISKLEIGAWGGRVTDAGMALVLQAFPTLRCLQLDNSGFGYATVIALVAHCPQLRELDFCSNDPFLPYINEGARKLSQLSHLHALRFAVPNDLSVFHAYPSLTHLDLAQHAGDDVGSDACIAALVHGCTALRTLHIYSSRGRCATLSEACASELRASRNGTGCSIELYD